MPGNAIPAEEQPSAAQKPPHVLHVIYPSPFEAVRSLLTIIVVALFALTFILQPFRIPSESMERTLLVGDFLLVNKTIYGGTSSIWRHLLPYKDVADGDIVVFHFPLNPPEHVVKRVVGVPGDRIRFVNGVVYRNGKALTEPHAVYETAEEDSFRDQFPAGGYTNPGIDPHWFQHLRAEVQNGELVVPADSYFVLGDNRNHSRDSRYWGFVPRENIVGRPFLIYFSLRQPSTTDLPEFPQVRAGQAANDKLGHEEVANRIADFARWSRMLRIVR
ncbi:signal peptidase I [Silvibacterium dinghuense]|uniref:Signal peptidase I n=1 Tax=Silvibacterium dinghuense TaxID=1560006 RepID=A0A4Q1S9T6_9BACT|nr:signal peptidase I [Silvibacterium dinghuense]RXS93446.1 signal peptidase I [Silvibacterium dinghuense]